MVPAQVADHRPVRLRQTGDAVLCRNLPRQVVAPGADVGEKASIVEGLEW
jgi:hypothetical protein